MSALEICKWYGIFFTNNFVYLGSVERNFLAEVVVDGRQDKVEVVLLAEAEQDVLHGAAGALVHFQEAHLGLRKAHRKQPRVQQPAQTH